MTHVQKNPCQQKLSQNYQDDHKMQKGVNFRGQIRVFESREAKIEHFANLGPKLHFPV
jgi:hypothetical protein